MWVGYHIHGETNATEMEHEKWKLFCGSCICIPGDEGSEVKEETTVLFESLW